MKPATPLPWSSVGPKTAEKTVIMSHSKNLGAFERDDAAYIVHACNAYPKLVEAIHMLLQNPSGEYGHHSNAAGAVKQLLRELGELK